MYLLLPQTPMIFMGEEWQSDKPFPYFCDFHGELAEKVREGRRNQFQRFPEFRDPASRDCIPDPLAKSTFLSAKPDWDKVSEGNHAECLERHRKLISVRQDQVVPLLGLIAGNAGPFVIVGPSAVAIHWRVKDGRELQLYANLSDREKKGFPETTKRILWHQGPTPEGDKYLPWTVRWVLKDA